MGDRFFENRHPNLELMLRRPPFGIGHNGGPPLDEPKDMSWIAWRWRKVVQKAWAPPPREILLRRLRQAGRLGLTWRDYHAAHLDTGSNLSTALLPLHHLVDGDGGYSPAIAAALNRFEGRLLLLVDVAASSSIAAAERNRLLQRLNADFAGKIEAILLLPFRVSETDAARALRLRRLLKQHHAPRKECFWLGATPAESRLAEQAGLGWFKPVATWFSEPAT